MEHNLPKENLCMICAWRESCKKKFSISRETAARCTEFSMDVRLKAKKGQETPETQDPPPNS